MKNEIGKDFYCSAGCYDNGCKSPFRVTPAFCLGKECLCYHRKWPTPEQFKNEYGEEHLDDAAVYYRDNDFEDWQVDIIEGAYDDERYQIVCACTPFSKPDKDWRP